MRHQEAWESFNREIYFQDYHRPLQKLLPAYPRLLSTQRSHFGTSAGLARMRSAPTEPGVSVKTSGGPNVDSRLMGLGPLLTKVGNVLDSLRTVLFRSHSSRLRYNQIFHLAAFKLSLLPSFDQGAPRVSCRVVLVKGSLLPAAASHSSL